MKLPEVRLWLVTLVGIEPNDLGPICWQQPLLRWFLSKWLSSVASLNFCTVSRGAVGAVARPSGSRPRMVSSSSCCCSLLA